MELKNQQLKPHRSDETQAGNLFEAEPFSELLKENNFRDDLDRFTIYETPAVPEKEPQILPDLFERPTFTEEFE
jgi:hypothetical protein